MRVKLKGLNQSRKKLADGTTVTYYYAWRGGPRLEGKPGSPEFMESYNLALEERKGRHRKDNLRWLIDDYLGSAEFKLLSERSQKDYAAHARLIDAEFGDMPLKLLEDRRARGEFLAWRDQLAIKSRRNADYRFAILARVLSWGLNRGLISTNPCEKPGKLYRASRKDKVWSAQDEATFYEKAPDHMHLALKLALWTGQRQGDLLALTWAQYDGTHIRLTQQKTGKRVIIPVAKGVREDLNALRAQLHMPMDQLRSRNILRTTLDQPWTRFGFGSSWRKACAKAGVVGLTFHDLRGTAVTRLALAGCSEAEIATITGHSMKDVGSILDANYLHRDSRLAESAIRKLEESEETSN